MDLYLRDPQKWQELYSCEYLNQTQWNQEGVPNLLLGSFYLYVGLFFIVLYVMCIGVMCQKQFRRHSCLKIMINIGLMDMGNLIVNSVFTGYMTIIGGVYCTHPLANYVLGAWVMCAWTNCSTSSLLLSLNRVLELLFPKRMDDLFGGYKIFLWLLIPYLEGLYFLIYSPAPMFSSKSYGWFFDPYFGMDFIPVDRDYFHNTWAHSVHNIGTSVLFAFLYAIHISAMWWKTRSSNNENMSKTRRTLFIQSILICSLNFSASVTYVYIEHIDPPRLLVIVAHALWIGCNCGAVIIYLTVNRTIRREFVKLFVPKKYISMIVAPSTHQSTHQTAKSVAYK
ncbi:hypothetical protein L596_030135 [Steinernema carpocapsae]|uniref:G-protein coupled receptors family 1 profile domain-containing protein n=1 Tax=Steinernema carpocapsae TaxID=34508 RepID=A0A4V5ZX78_STECR|nr:hypothetical protein L596_030135 [Steinernema carpocapsae]